MFDDLSGLFSSEHSLSLLPILLNEYFPRFKDLDPLDGFLSALNDDLEDLLDLADGVLDMEVLERTDVLLETAWSASLVMVSLGSTGVAGISLRDGPVMVTGPPRLVGLGDSSP